MHGLEHFLVHCLSLLQNHWYFESFSHTVHLSCTRQYLLPFLLEVFLPLVLAQIYSEMFPLLFVIVLKLSHPVFLHWFVGGNHAHEKSRLFLVLCMGVDP